MKKIAIIGSTGSIGTQTLDIVRANKDIEVVALSCGKKIDLFEKQIREFKPKFASIENEELAKDLKERLSDISGVEIAFGKEGLVRVATAPDAEIVVTAIVGMIGVEPTIAAIEAGKDIALANKETLVTAGHIIMPLAKEKGVRILPVDSEHSAIFQCISQSKKGDGSPNQISRLLITASGGPFRGRTRDELRNVSVEDALKHPNWSMGSKITIDSATLVNKGLEVIEARHLFNVLPENIEVVVQPQSIIHSMVEFEDGAVMAQLGTPDMKLPIQYALYFPDRRYLAGDRLDFTKMKEIVIDTPDRETFKGLDFAYRSLNEGGVMSTIFNAANEYAVAAFLARKIKFLDIYDIIEYSMDNVKNITDPTVKDILDKQKETKEVIRGRFGIWAEC
ncbi:MAG TPA: 1-deoxy-D-xylulose-5-phosphate reductoisomerase [Lachnospiraceae bacterium]|nr:1-deoxy-D-xylulose-5-phosphate reductoisomerase [Lachnospiraceae bacterium]